MRRARALLPCLCFAALLSITALLPVAHSQVDFLVDDSVDWSQYIDADEILPSADYDDYDYVESGSSSDGKQLESIEELLDLFDDSLNTTALDPLGERLLREDLDAAAFDDVLQRVASNIDLQLSRLGTSSSEIWDWLAEYLAQRNSTSSAANTTADTNSTATDPTDPSKAWVKAKVHEAVDQYYATQDTSNTTDADSAGTQSADTDAQPNLIAEVLLSVLSAANSTGAPVNATAGGGGEEGLSGGARRKLQQAGAAGTNSRIASAFRLVFGSFLDLLNGGGRFYATILTNLAAFLLNNNLIRELSFYPEAPLNNFISTNQVPVPASNAAALALLVATINGYCNLQTLGAATQVLGAITAPTITISLVPASCPVLEDENTGRRSISWESCVPAALTIRTTPWTVDLPFVTGTSFTAGSCRYSYFLGTDQTYSVGGGNAGFTLRRSTRGFQIIPIVNQVNLVARVNPYIFPSAPYVYGPSNIFFNGSSNYYSFNYPGPGTGISGGGAVVPPAGTGTVGTGSVAGGVTTGTGGLLRSQPQPGADMYDYIGGVSSSGDLLARQEQLYQQASALLSGAASIGSVPVDDTGITSGTAGPNSGGSMFASAPGAASLRSGAAAAPAGSRPGGATAQAIPGGIQTNPAQGLQSSSTGDSVFGQAPTAPSANGADPEQMTVPGMVEYSKMIQQLAAQQGYSPQPTA